MAKLTHRGKIYYTTREEAEATRRKGDRLYYAKNKGYYLVRTNNRGFW